MPIIRNPFRRQDENARPTSGVVETTSNKPAPPKSIDLGEKQSTEYKLSEINDSGVCLPPSPGEERKSFWGQTNSSRSTTSSTHRSLIKDNEPFNISRESFDSYRRSFDISGRSPVMNGDRPRASLDSRTFQSFQSSPRKSTNLARPGPGPIVPPMREEEDFEDVGLNDDPKPAQQAPPKKRGFLSRLTDSNSDQATVGAQDSKWHFGGRKRGQSGQGAELGSMPNREDTPKPVAPESGLRHSETPTKAEGSVQAPTTTSES
ncbi:hypothetical protein Q7P37_001247 [Cladosporium fusiforme]